MKHYYILYYNHNMPFTTSHPAAVMPLKHVFPRHFSLTGLMAGAVSPDLLYFLILGTTHRGLSHSWPGLFIFCLPAGILFAFAFHRLFKFHVILNLPSPLDRLFSGLALSRFHPAGFRQWTVLVYSVLLGAMSHFLWDSFTHSRGEIAKRIPFILEESTILGMTLSNYTVIQHISTIVGGIAVLIYFFKSRLLPKPELGESVVSSSGKIRFWFFSAGFAVIFAASMVIFKVGQPGRYLFDMPRLLVVLKTFGLAGWAGFFYFVCTYTLISNPAGLSSRIHAGYIDKDPGHKGQNIDFD
jgi:hypothetical protein